MDGGEFTRFKGKTVVLGVTGSIAAYKACEVASSLRKLGACVHVIMTPSATRFVAPLTFRTLSGNPVVVDMFEDPGEWDVLHVSLARKADVLVVAPATANLIGKVASGIADDMLTATIMATRAPVLFVPAMNTRMYENPVFQQNVAKLAGLGYRFMAPDEGRLACGEVGKGRMPDPQDVVNEIGVLLGEGRDLEGIAFLITAGPTQEPLDPVRFISNPSSGRMGYALAESAARRGARVILVTGPTSLPLPAGVEEVFSVRTAEEMYARVMENFPRADAVIKAAAVADYRPVKALPHKMKKTEGRLCIELERTPDILLELGRIKGRKILVGFAAETEDLVENAIAKLRAKNLDLVVANDLTQPGAGFGVDTNQVKLVDAEGRVEDIPLATKREVAERILDRVGELVRKSKAHPPSQ